MNAISIADHARLALARAHLNAGDSMLSAATAFGHVPEPDFTHDVPVGAIPVAGLVPSDDDPDDYPFVASGRSPLYEMDFRPECSPIRDQGKVGACTAFQVDGHCGRYAKRAGRPDLAYSPRANYAMSRQLMGLTGDSGASLRASIHATYKYGIPTEAQFPYGTDWQAIINTGDLPPAIVADAAQHKLGYYYRIAATPIEVYNDEFIINKRIDRALADGYTVGVGAWLHYWIYFIKGPLSTHAALRNNPPAGFKGNWGAVIGGHAFVIEGRSDTLGGYICRWSWNTTWGDAGHYLMPYADTAEAFEFWAVAGFDGSNIVNPPYSVDCNEARAARLYRAAFARYPDKDGLAYQANDLGNIGELQVARNFMASPEFQAMYGPSPTDENFVLALYHNVLHRDPDAAGYQFQLAALKGGLERAQLLINFSESPENRTMP